MAVASPVAGFARKGCWLCAFALLLPDAPAQQVKSNREPEAKTSTQEDDRTWKEALKPFRDRHFPPNFQRTDLQEDMIPDLRPIWNRLAWSYPDYHGAIPQDDSVVRYFDSSFTIYRSADGQPMNCHIVGSAYDSFEKAEIGMLKRVHHTSLWPRKGRRSKPAGQVSVHWGDLAIVFYNRNVTVWSNCSAPWYRPSSTDNEAAPEKFAEFIEEIDDYIRKYRAPAK
jgi:hypothetical protein